MGVELGTKREEMVGKPEGIMGMQEFKERFDPFLEGFLDQKRNDLTEFTSDLPILDYVDYTVRVTTERGKRIRPYMAYLMYSALGGDNTEGALKALTSLELFHSFSLIHDDIADEGSTRHGLETVHLYIAGKIKERGITDHLRVGKSQATILGDLLYNWSQEALNTSVGFPQETKNKLGKNFNRMADKVAIGQMIDVDLPTRKTVPTTLIGDKIMLKTASYTFIEPMLIGAVLAGKDTDDVKKFCEEFGLLLGIAFQTQDDFFDIMFSEEILGKTSSSDTKQRQHTYFTQYVRENGTHDQKERLNALSKLLLTPESRTEIQQIFAESGAIDFGQKLISANIVQAQKLIDKAPIGTNGKNGFTKLIKDMAVRTH